MSDTATIGIPPQRELHVFGGATAEATGEHPASERIARRVAELASVFLPSLATRLHLTDAAGGTEGIASDDDLLQVAHNVAANFPTKMVVWLPDSPQMKLGAQIFRRSSVNGMAPRKDIFLSTLTPTHGATGQQQYLEGLGVVKASSANLDLAYDYDTGNGMVVAPEETTYDESTDLDAVVRNLLEISWLRANLTFTHSTVVDGKLIDWNGPDVYPCLRDVVNFCIKNGAYKPFMGTTAGHFAAKVAETEFVTSIRKTNFNNLDTTGMVRVRTDGPDRVVAFGAKPSVGGQSQRIVFAEHPELDSIVHFHCPPRPGSEIMVMSQREFECGSHECGQNTSRGLTPIADGIEAVYLDNHGPNVVFNHDIDPLVVQEVLADHFDFTRKTGGYQLDGPSLGLVA